MNYFLITTQDDNNQTTSSVAAKNRMEALTIVIEKLYLKTGKSFVILSKIKINKKFFDFYKTVCKEIL